MFKTNNDHIQQSLYESSEWMSPNVRTKLDKSWAPIFYNHVFCKINEEPFAVLYGKTGKPNFPVNIMLSLEYIKHMKNCNDLELIEDFYFDYLVNYAVGVRTLGEKNLAERTLYYFRERIYGYCLENPNKEDLLFGQFNILLQDFAKEAGISMKEQRTDTMLFMSNIKKAGRISLAYDVLMKALKAVPACKLTIGLSEVLEPDFKTNMLYRTKPQESESKLEILLNLCKEALDILKNAPEAAAEEEIRITERFINEQSTINESNGKLIPKPNNEISASSLQSAYDEEATYRFKSKKGHSGYVLEISETCGDANPFQLITDYAVKANNINDAEILSERLETIKENTGCDDMYVDGGFHSEAVHQQAEANGIKMHLTNMSGTQPTKKIPVTEFDIDEGTKTIIKCPAGHSPIRTSICKGQTTAHFAHGACDSCPMRERCHSKKQVKGCVVRISLKSISVGLERAKMKAHQLENTSKRAGIEGSNSALKRKGMDKLNVRGIIKCDVVSGLKVTVQNIKRFIKYIRGGYAEKKVKLICQGVVAPI